MRSTVHQITADEFEALTRRLGLNPDDYDMAELRRAYQRLDALMTRLGRPDRPPDAESLSVFDPTRAP